MIDYIEKTNDTKVNQHLAAWALINIEQSQYSAQSGLNSEVRAFNELEQARERVFSALSSLGKVVWDRAVTIDAGVNGFEAVMPGRKTEQGFVLDYEAYTTEVGEMFDAVFGSDCKSRIYRLHSSGDIADGLPIQEGDPLYEVRIAVGEKDLFAEFVSLYKERIQEAQLGVEDTLTKGFDVFSGDFNSLVSGVHSGEMPIFVGKGLGWQEYLDGSLKGVDVAERLTSPIQHIFCVNDVEYEDFRSGKGERSLKRAREVSLYTSAVFVEQNKPLLQTARKLVGEAKSQRGISREP
ncbi:hypothetical protein AB4254_08580 [Vibrio breoganii]